MKPKYEENGDVCLHTFLHAAKIFLDQKLLSLKKLLWS